MNYEYEIKEELFDLADEVMREREDLEPLLYSNARICFITSTEYKKSKTKRVFADARLVKGVWTAFCPYDFIITFYDRNTSLLNNEQIKILMWHELKHCGVTEDGRYYLIPHDIEDFSTIIDECGYDWANTKQVGGEAELDED